MRKDLEDRWVLTRIVLDKVWGIEPDSLQGNFVLNFALDNLKKCERCKNKPRNTRSLIVRGLASFDEFLQASGMVDPDIEAVFHAYNGKGVLREHRSTVIAEAIQNSASSEGHPERHANLGRRAVNRQIIL